MQGHRHEGTQAGRQGVNLCALGLVFLGGGRLEIPAWFPVIMAEGANPSNPPLPVSPEHATYLPAGLHIRRLLLRLVRCSIAKNSRTLIPSAPASFSSMSTVGLMWPFSILDTVTNPTPALRASSRTEYPRRSLHCRSRTGMDLV